MAERSWNSSRPKRFATISRSGQLDFELHPFLRKSPFVPIQPICRIVHLLSCWKTIGLNRVWMIVLIQQVYRYTNSSMPFWTLILLIFAQRRRTMSTCDWPILFDFALSATFIFFFASAALCNYRKVSQNSKFWRFNFQFEQQFCTFYVSGRISIKNIILSFPTKMQ